MGRVKPPGVRRQWHHPAVFYMHYLPRRQIDMGNQPVNRPRITIVSGILTQKGNTSHRPMTGGNLINRITTSRPGVYLNQFKLIFRRARNTALAHRGKPFFIGPG